ncbi:MAG: isoprenyl transferase [Bacteroidales bacterium]|nr:isoprenyl transferase [Bacteroidales bacterium]
MSDFFNQIDKTRVPQHIAIIMDGNGRWAKQQSQERVYGHQFGVEAVRRVIEAAAEVGVKYLTLYTFSTENWNRPKAEVEALMGLLVKAVHDELEKLKKNNVRLKAIGQISDLPDHCRAELQRALDETAEDTGLTVVLALSYGSRQEMVEVTRRAAEKVRLGEWQPEDINVQNLSALMYDGELPDPDILIRTGGECRISNFLLWQLAYSELFFLPVMWPDFQKQDLWQVICQFQNRERRFGKTSEQVQTHL